MALIQVNVHEVQPGRVGEFLDNQRKVAAVQTRLGAQRRLIRRASGEGPGLTFSVVLEYDGWDGYAEFQSRATADADYAALMATLTANTDPPSRVVSLSYATDVEL